VGDRRNPAPIGVGTMQRTPIGNERGIDSGHSALTYEFR
jgi:hypothetical protein